MTIQYPVTSQVVDGIVFNGLFLPGHTPKFENVTIKGGVTYMPGTVLGQITATGKFVMSAAAAGDGSEVPIAVLTMPIATFDTDGVTALDMKASVVVHEGYFNETALIFGAGFTIAQIKSALLARGIFTRAPGYSG